ncbi:MAG TPA: hypothetical protein PLF04_08500 [Candidatus Fermentibacter daniensis]|mgnify:CR=1 FL=1|jgi:hypothetical protein|nr:MAG: hypothetical protein AO394_07240 [Candidatus Fermentibacter daniensis]MBP7720577.1 hypothetical protein [Candidatus Fermentibacter sp.]KZD17161.1 MAG: hypothetical protein AO395_02515 [Candidatus Fermentibacter daniensis]KZD19746.1 MAG: hypothetical protein AO396_01650 [Candidatus Fermentibacter daniensis]MCC6871591.1 hypothetical protein [Candidatus Fermentibacter sp.]
MELIDWNGRTVAAERSRSGVTALLDVSDNLIAVPSGSGDLPNEVRNRIAMSDRDDGFDSDEMARLSAGLGFYSDMQSLRCVDPATWSVFGTVAASGARERAFWVQELLGRIGLSYNPSEPVEVSLWKTLGRVGDVEGTLETDASVITRDAAVFFEASWFDPDNSGASGGDVRAKLRFLSSLSGGRMSKEEDRLVLVQLRLHGDSPLRPGKYDGVELRHMSWQYLVSLGSHPLYDEVNRYYDWKLGLLG